MTHEPISPHPNWQRHHALKFSYSSQDSRPADDQSGSIRGYHQSNGDIVVSDGSGGGQLGIIGLHDGGWRYKAKGAQQWGIAFDSPEQCKWWLRDKHCRERGIGQDPPDPKYNLYRGPKT